VQGGTGEGLLVLDPAIPGINGEKSILLLRVCYADGDFKYEDLGLGNSVRGTIKFVP